jgi:hypothetical protein
MCIVRMNANFLRKEPSRHSVWEATNSQQSTHDDLSSRYPSTILPVSCSLAKSCTVAYQEPMVLECQQLKR